MESAGAPSIRVVFSDVDGTLVHYADEEDGPRPAEASGADGADGGGGVGAAAEPVPGGNDDGDGDVVLRLPPSSTGMRGVISARSLRLCRELRRGDRGGAKLVLVSGMRTTTLLRRLPFLPRADAYASEAGSRIFFPVDLSDEAARRKYRGPVIRPQKYNGASDADLAPFGVEEDSEWRAAMESVSAAGRDGYAQDGTESDSLSGRNGALWDFARSLEAEGFVVDFEGYAACFRVNRKQQTSAETRGGAFDALLESAPPDGLARSVNLGCVDFYPEASGKKNCCAYLARKFVAEDDRTEMSSGDDLLGEVAVCICDDDNDLEMALACAHAYLPSVTSSSMADAVKAHPGQISVTQSEEDGILGVLATEEALGRILRELEKLREQS